MKTSILISLAAFFTSVASAQFGTLDASFDEDGMVTTEFGSYKSAIRAIALQEDGKIIAAGSTYNTGSYHRFALTRYNCDGSIDTSFGTDGKVVGTNAEEKMAITSIFVQPDGKIVGSGIIYKNYFNSEFMLVRFNPDGSPDEDFGNNGLLSMTSTNINCVKMQADGKIVAAGFRYFSNNQRDMAVLRFNPDGTFDQTFGQNGMYVTNVGARDFANALDLLPDGRILVGGAIFNGSHSDFCLMRLMPDGNRDQGFGLDGIASYDYDEDDEIISVRVQPDGKILFSGFTGDDGDYSFALMRVHHDGQVDHDFGDDGFITGPGANLATSLEIQSDGKILVSGSYQSETGKEVALSRYLSDGTPDAEFGENGLMTTAAAPSCQANAMLIQPDGKILLGGEAGSTGGSYNPDFALMRYHSGAPLSVNEPIAEGMFSVFPNPVRDGFRISTNVTSNELFTIELFDVNGRMISELGQERFELGLSKEYQLPANLASGTYFVSVTSGRGRSVIRLVH